MKTVKIVPKSKRAKDRIREHGPIMELLADKEHMFMVRSLEQSFTYRKDVMGFWLGWFTKEEAGYENV